MAKRKTTVADTLYVETYRNTKSPAEIARDLELTVLTVQKLIDVAVEKEAAALPKKPPTMTQIAFKQNKQPGSVAERYGVTIMSPTASELGDTASKKGSKGRDDCIYRPKPE